MALIEERFSIFQNCVPVDAYHDLRLAKTGNASFDKELRLLEEDESIDEDYKGILFCLLTKVKVERSEPHKKQDVIKHEERSEPREHQKDKDDFREHVERLEPQENRKGKDGVNEHEKRLEQKKRKNKDDVSDHGDDCNVEEDDPAYELFLRHLKEHDRSYVLEYEKDRLPVVIKYEGDIDSDKECNPEPEPRRKLSRAMEKKTELSHQMPRVENQGKHDQHLVSVKETESLTQKELRDEVEKVENMNGPPNDIVPDPECLRLNQSVKLKDGQYADMHKAHNVANKKIYGVNDPKKQDRRMLPRAVKHKPGPSNQTGSVENQHMHVPQSISVKKNKNTDKLENEDGSPNDMVPISQLFLHQNVEHGGDRDVIMRKGHTVVNEKINDQKREDGRKLHRAMKPNQIPGVEKKRCTSVTKTKSLTGRKSRNETDKEEKHRNDKLEDDHYVYKHDMVNEKMSGVKDQKKQRGRNLDRNMLQKVGPSNQMPRAENQQKQMRKHDPQSASAKKTKSLTLRKSRNETRKEWIEKCSASEFRKAMAAKCVMAYKNIDENDHGKEGNGTSDSDVEILDEAAFLKKGILSPFVSSKKFSKSMVEDGIQHIGRSSERDEFRKGVLNVLKRPYDREEYKRHLEAVRAGHYLDYHPDLGSKLKKYRYNRVKRLTILRGFFFWLQNLTQEGSFKPWKDRACLVVEPRSPQNLPNQDDGKKH